MIRDELLNMQDREYKQFIAKLVPTIDSAKIIGIRTPALRKYAKSLFETPDAEVFVSSLPHAYFEENNLHSFLLEKIKDFDKCLSEVERFLPYIDNWATCDSFNPACFKNNKSKLINSIRKWILSPLTYECRFGMLNLMRYYLEDDMFKEEYFDWIADVKSEEYYIKMMQAWFFATALAKQYEKTYDFLSEKRLDVWTHNKAIQKARESFRLSEENKQKLALLKIKSNLKKLK